MKNAQLTNPNRPFIILAVLGFVFWLQPLLKADVVVLQDGRVLAGKILQKDGDGVLIQMESGTYRYPQSWLRDVKKEAVAAPHVSNNGQRIPDWAQIVMLLANNTWAQGLKQVPATMIETGIWKNVPYISFRCQYDGYELNIFGDLNKPAAIQIGAMKFLKDSDEARSNCVNFVCSVLANADDRKSVRALNWTQDDKEKNGELIAQTLMPGEFESYGGWWVSVYSESALAASRASDAELFALTQPSVAAPQPAVATTQPAAATTAVVGQPAPANPQPAATIPQPAASTTTTDPYAVTTYGVPAWTAEEMAYARRVTPGVPGVAPAATAATAAKVYPRTYTRTDGAYGRAEARRR